MLVRSFDDILRNKVYDFLTGLPANIASDPSNPISFQYRELKDKRRKTREYEVKAEGGMHNEVTRQVSELLCAIDGNY